MVIHKSKRNNSFSDLKVDVWKQSHDKENKLHETFEGEYTMKGQIEQKYLGCTLSNDGTNTKCIKMKINKSIGTRKTIKTLIKYTIESGIT